MSAQNKRPGATARTDRKRRADARQRNVIKRAIRTKNERLDREIAGLPLSGAQRDSALLLAHIRLRIKDSSYNHLCQVAYQGRFLDPMIIDPYWSF